MKRKRTGLRNGFQLVAVVTLFTVEIQKRWLRRAAQVHQAEVLGITVTDRRRLGALTKSSGSAQDAIIETQRLEKTATQQGQPFFVVGAMSGSCGVAAAANDLPPGVTRQPCA